MELGKEKPAIHIEPLEDTPAPKKEPVAPAREVEVEREPEKVPA